jgi:transposase-like protein
MPHRRWTPEEKIRIVLESLNTNIGVAELCRKYAVNLMTYETISLRPQKTFSNTGGHSNYD